LPRMSGTHGISRRPLQRSQSCSRPSHPTSPWVFGQNPSYTWRVGRRRGCSSWHRISAPSTRSPAFVLFPRERMLPVLLLNLSSTTDFFWFSILLVRSVLCRRSAAVAVKGGPTNLENEQIGCAPRSSLSSFDFWICCSCWDWCCATYKCLGWQRTCSTGLIFSIGVWYATCLLETINSQQVGRWRPPFWLQLEITNSAKRGVSTQHRCFTYS
jgi:hypothetical protein